MKISKSHVCYEMSASNPAAARLGLGIPCTVETEDCYSGQLQSSTDVWTKEMWATVNPATGPIFIEDTKPGDVLRIAIRDIRMREHAVMSVEPGAGALAGQIAKTETVFLPIRHGLIEVLPGQELPLRPMIGVIGTAPGGKPIPNSTPGEHGGNMDCKEIAVGTVLYLPVEVEGALLALGDLHALMGDGEVCICGAEVSGEVDLEVTLDSLRRPTPCVESEEWIQFMASAKSLDECERLVLAKTHRFLTAHLGLGANEAARLMSLVGNLGVCQVVNPLKTMKFSLPKSVLGRVSKSPPA